MQFYSSNSPQKKVSLQEAVLHSLPQDRGLYMPETIIPFADDFWSEWQDMSFAELSYQIAQQLLQESVPADVLRIMVEEAINFEAPLVPITQNIQVLELFHGPTLAFKDFGARFMARLMSYLNPEKTRPLTVLVATSGDTGGAVAHAFHRVAHTEVVILYPKGGVSALQEKQLTTLGDNVVALEVQGTFDHCQAMVKECFIDQELREQLYLTSANSINIARLIPQTFYYFYAVAQRQKQGHTKPPTFVVPSGNFGNLTAGLIARRLGLPVAHFIAATNRNDVIPRYLKNGVYEAQPSIATLSNAMDVGSPSNFARMQDLFQGEWAQMCAEMSGYSYSDEETVQAMIEVEKETQYLLDPHGAVAYLAAQQWLKEQGECSCIILGTAHPSKFKEQMQEYVRPKNLEIPERLARLEHLTKQAIPMQPQGECLKNYLLERKSV